MQHLNHLTGSYVVHLKRVNSTNTFLSELLANNEPRPGTVIIADYQTNGRGQRTNSGTLNAVHHATWESEPAKNILASALYYPDFLPIERLFQFNQIVSLAILDWAATYVSSDFLALKWPNDLYYLKMKLGGILIEPTLGNNVKAAVVGIGLNVNQIDFDEAPNAVSIAGITNHQYDLGPLLQNLYSKLDYWYNQLQLGHEKFIDEAYMANLFGYEKTINFKADGDYFAGTIVGVKKTGHLQVETNNRLKSFAPKSIEFLL